MHALHGVLGIAKICSAWFLDIRILTCFLRFLVTFHLLIPKTVWNWNKDSKLGISFINTEQSIVRSLDHHEW